MKFSFTVAFLVVIHTFTIFETLPKKIETIYVSLAVGCEHID